MSNAELELDLKPEDSLSPEATKRYREILENRPWKLYHPIPVVEKFHQSLAPLRVLSGPNRGGKTTAGAYELICYATGYNPIRKVHYPTPNVTWAIALDYQNMGSVVRRTLFSMLPKGFRYYKMESRIVLPKPWGSEIVVKSADAGREKFQGEGLQAAWFDEEPIGEAGHEIFKEVYARRKPGVPLQIFMTYTPLQGMSWSYHKLWNKKSPELLPGVETFSFDLYDCTEEKGGFLTLDEVKTIERGYSFWERKARVHGQYTFIGGTPYFDPGGILNALQRQETPTLHTIRQKLGALPGISAISLEARDDGPFRVYRPPLKGHQYIIGVDVGGGVGRDATVASVWDRDDLVQSAEWHSNSVDPQEFGAFILPAIGHFYNQAEIVVEVNGEHGGTVTSQLRGKYRKLYMRQNWDSANRKIVNEYGFRTNTRTKGMVLDTLSRVLREDVWVPSAPLLEEMGQFIADKNGSGEAMDGCFDDRVMAAGIGLLVHFENPRVKINPDDYKITYQKCDHEWMGY